MTTHPWSELRERMSADDPDFERGVAERRAELETQMREYQRQHLEPYAGATSDPGSEED